MTMPNETAGPVPALKKPRTNVALIRYARQMLLAWTGNQYLPNPDPTLASFKAHVDAFDAAETLARTKAQGTAAARDAAKQKVLQDMDHLRDYAKRQVEAATDLTIAVAIIESAAMKVKLRPKRNKEAFAVQHGAMSGIVLLIAKSIAEDAVYYWQVSTDQKNWSSVPDTMKASTSIGGLTPGQTYWFRFRAMARKTAIDWSQPISIIVK